MHEPAIEFLEHVSPFKQGPGISSILHGGDVAFGKYFLCGELGIGFSTTGSVMAALRSMPADSGVA